MDIKVVEHGDGEEAMPMGDEETSVAPEVESMEVALVEVAGNLMESTLWEAQVTCQETRGSPRLLLSPRRM